MVKFYKALLLSNYKRIGLYIYSAILLLVIFSIGVLGLVLDKVLIENTPSYFLTIFTLPTVFFINILVMPALFYRNIYLNTTGSSLEILSFSSGLSRKKIFLAKFLNFFTLILIHFFALFLISLFPFYVGFSRFFSSGEIFLGGFLGFLTFILLSLLLYFFMFFTDTLGKKAKTKRSKSFIPLIVAVFSGMILSILSTLPFMEMSKPTKFNNQAQIQLLSKNGEDLKIFKYWKNDFNFLDKYKEYKTEKTFGSIDPNNLVNPKDIESFKSWNIKNDVYTFFPAYLSLSSTIEEFGFGGLTSKKKPHPSFSFNNKNEISNKIFDDAKQHLVSAATNLSKDEIYFYFSPYSYFESYKFKDYSNSSNEFTDLFYFNDIKYENIFKASALSAMNDTRWSGEEVELNSLINEIHTIYKDKLSEGASESLKQLIQKSDVNELSNFIVYNLFTNGFLNNKKLKFNISDELITKMNEYIKKKEASYDIEKRRSEDFTSLTEQERQQLNELTRIKNHIIELKKQEPFWNINTFSSQEAFTFIDSKPITPKSEITFPIIFILLALVASASFIKYERKDFA